MAESKTPAANYKARNDIVLQDDTTLVATSIYTPSQTARTQHLTKMDAVATDLETLASTAHGGAVTSGNVKRGKN